MRQSRNRIQGHDHDNDVGDRGLGDVEGGHDDYWRQ